MEKDVGTVPHNNKLVKLWSKWNSLGDSHSNFWLQFTIVLRLWLTADGKISLAEFGPKWMEATAFGETDTMAIFMKYFTMLGDPTDMEHITPRNVMEIWEDVLMAGKSNTSNQ